MLLVFQFILLFGHRSQYSPHGGAHTQIQNTSLAFFSPNNINCSYKFGKKNRDINEKEIIYDPKPVQNTNISAANANEKCNNKFEIYY